MHYEMEELLPVVAKLAEKYNGFESTSMTYERAEQLMEAVLYCIHELEMENTEAIMSVEKVSAQKAYETGLERVKKKVEMTLTMYNTISSEFVDYGNRCLYDTFIKGLPAFFKWYDVRFDPQNTILTLDYPVLKDLSKYSGIDRIYEYVDCIRLEQNFLKRFPEGYVTDVLRRYDFDYQEMIENLCEIVYAEVLIHALTGKEIFDLEFQEEDRSRLQRIFANMDHSDVEKRLAEMTDLFVREYWNGDKQLSEYLIRAAQNIVVRLCVICYNSL